MENPNMTVIKQLTDKVNLVKLAGYPDYVGVSCNIQEYCDLYNMEKLSPYILEYYKKISKGKDCVIAGYSALGIYNNKFIYQPITVFFKNPDYIPCLKEIYNELKNNGKFEINNELFHINNIKKYQTRDNIYISFDFMKIVIKHNPVVIKKTVVLEFSKCIFISSINSLDSFKIDCCCIMWDGSDFMYNSRFVNSYQTKTNIFDPRYSSDLEYIKELLYYAKSGYTILFHKDNMEYIYKIPIYSVYDVQFPNILKSDTSKDPIEF